MDSGQSPEPKPTGRFGKATATALLSILLPGLGQVYNRQPRKGLLIAATFPLLALGLGESHALLSFWGLVGSLSVIIGWRLCVAADAARVGWTGGNRENQFQKPRLVIPIVIVLVVLLNVFPTSGQFLRRYHYFRAFSVPSESMCPTICPGERIVADMDAYHSRNPQRGELVLLKLSETEALLIKRVIGVAGDTVEAGPKNEVIVDGKPFNPPGSCGTPLPKKNLSLELPQFASTTVPEGTFFVVGDNLANSNDSRFPEFGLVSANQLRGKPLFVYWSPGRSRIGCPTQ